MEILKWLTDWYKSNCDGDWEHSYGIKINTLDNPGWFVGIDLVDTKKDGKIINIKVDNTDDDWYSIKSEGSVFEGYGDSSKLPLLISKFKEFVESSNVQVLK
ncbi:rhodanese-related sulfurtransferase [Pedobacter frigidisoli]|uniref:Rhodanese-related sulfurtransferase n=1 Tax=Pedobacter frigidisoli TaxID=2530455 RepID=A0A4R0NYX4_9SPHI|nr:immunity 53 family protein [Pedobacter frigidisoli]TCD05848.1 rhodanese-related sulfurtransferase [Pedobacter frigidisoli]